MARTPDKSQRPVSELSEELHKILDCAEAVREALQVIDGLGLKLIEVDGYSSVKTALEKMTVIARTLPLNAKTAARRDADIKGAAKKKG